MHSVLVTGGGGYIGSHVALALQDAGEDVVILDDLSAGQPVNDSSGMLFVQGSIEDPSLVKNLIKEHEIDTIFHLAAFIKVEESMQYPEKYFKNNTENTRTLLDAAQTSGVKNIIFSSTAAVYGNPTKMPISEDDALKPINPYGESKVRAEKLVQESGMSSVILRYFNVGGADALGRAGYRIESHPSHLIRALVRVALEGREFTVFGTDYSTPDGTCVRDFIHVSDIAQAHADALVYLRAGSQSQIFNCGYGRGYSVAEVIEAVGRVSGKEIKVHYGLRRVGDPAILVANNARIRKHLSWRPQNDNLDTIIYDEIVWVRSQRVGTV